MTPEQQAAIAEVREYLARDKGEGERIAVNLYIWMAGTTTYWDEQGREVTKPTGENASALAEAAYQDPAAWEAARRMVAAFAEHNEPIPPVLLEFTAETMRGERPKPTGGRPKHKNLARDLSIANAVYMLLSAGAQEYRNDERATGRVSAIESVADISNLSYGAVRAIWEKMKAHVVATHQHGPYYFVDQGIKLWRG